MPSSIPPVTVRFDQKTRDNLARFAKLTNRSRSYVINQAVEEFLSSRMSYLQELDEAVESVDTQPTYAAKEVFEWMNTWGTEEEKPLSESKLSSKDKS